MMATGARSYSREARTRVYPTAHIPAHAPKPGNPHQIQAHGPSLFRNEGNGGQKLCKRSEASSVSHRTYPRTYPKTWQPTSNPSITYLLSYLGTYLPKPVPQNPPPPKLARSKPENFMGRTYPRTYPHISPSPQMGPMTLQGALGGSPGRPPRWTQNRPPYGGICAGTSGICACKQIFMFTRGRGGYVRRFGGMCGRPAGYVRRGAPCVRGFRGYVRDMCVR